MREFFDSVSKLAAIDLNINDDVLIIKLLYSLPASFENIRLMIENRDALLKRDNLYNNVEFEPGKRPKEKAREQKGQSK